MENYLKRIEINPKILRGKPVFKGTRIPLYVVLDLLAEGTPVKKIIKFYPDLTEEDIRAAMRFASDTAKHIAEIKLETAHR
ncbi:MAG: DUF433 domain-containing protein [Nitrospirae bacterium]|nr:DUF433 domain-containing protein [Nitrospirota bacterium]